MWLTPHSKMTNINKSKCPKSLSIEYMVCYLIVPLLDNITGAVIRLPSTDQKDKHINDLLVLSQLGTHYDVIKWKHFPRYWPFMWGIHRSPVDSPHKGQWPGALMFFFDLRRNKRLSKQSRRRWFETPSRSLWRHCNDFGWLIPYLAISMFIVT